MSSLLDLGPQVVARYTSRGLAYQPCTADSFNSIWLIFVEPLLSQALHAGCLCDTLCTSLSFPAALCSAHSAYPPSRTLCTSPLWGCALQCPMAWPVLHSHCSLLPCPRSLSSAAGSVAVASCPSLTSDLDTYAAIQVWEGWWVNNF